MLVIAFHLILSRRGKYKPYNISGDGPTVIQDSLVSISRWSLLGTYLNLTFLGLFLVNSISQRKQIAGHAFGSLFSRRTVV